MNASRHLKRVGLIVVAIFASAHSADLLPAQEVVKANNTSTLVDGASWVGGNAPTSSSVIVWNSTVTGSNSPDLGGNLSIAGIKVTNPGGVVGIISGTVNSGSVTANSTTDTFTYTGADVANGNVVTFAGTAPGGISNSRPYFITNVNTAAKTYQVSDTANGSAINLTSTGSSVTNTVRYALSIGASGIDLSQTTRSLSVLAAPVSLSSTQKWTVPSGFAIDANASTTTVGVGILNNGYQLEIDGAGRTEIGFIGGTGGLVKNGLGTLVLHGQTAFSTTAPYAFSGNVMLNSGTVTVGTSNPTGASLLGTGASELTLGNVAVTFTTNSSGQNFDRNTTVAGNASLTIPAIPYRFGTLSIGEFTLSVLTSTTTADTTLTYGATTLTGNATFNVGTKGNNIVILGAVGESGGSRGFTKTGVGAIRVTGASTFTGRAIVSSGTLALTSAGSFSSESELQNDASFDVSAVTGASTTIGRLSGSGSVLLGGKTLVFGGSGDASFSGTITGSTGAVTKQGTGFQTLSGVNAYDGTTTISQGGLVIASMSALPGWNAAGRFSVANGASLAVGNSVANADIATLLGTGNFAAGSRIGFDTTAGDRSYGEVIADTSSGALGLTKLGGNALTLSGGNTFSGGVTVVDGSLSISTINNTSANGTLGNSASAVVLGSAGKAGTLSYTGATASSSKPFSAAAGGTAAFMVTDAAATLTLSGLIGGDGDKSFGGPGSIVAGGGISGGSSNVFKTGTGALTLAGASGHANTTVSQGRLNVNHFSALGTAAGTLSMAAGTTLDNTSGSNVGVTNGKSIALGSSLTFLGSSSLDLGPGTVTLSGSTAIDVAANTLTFSGDVVGTGYGLLKNGAGVLELAGLSGGSSFTGNSFINAGELYLSGNSVLGGGASTVVTVADGAFLRVGASASLGGVTVVSRPEGLITASVVNANQTFDQSGTLTSDNAKFNGVQTIRSGVTISATANDLGTVPGSPTAGRIVIENGATLRATEEFHIRANQGISLASGTGVFSVDASKALFIESTVAGSGGIRKVGAGNVRLTGSNSFTGGTVIEQGFVGITTDASLGDVTSRLKLDGGTIVAAQTISGGTVSGATINSGRQVVLANGKTSGMHAQTGLTLRYDGAIGEENGGGAAANLTFGATGSREGTVILGGANTYRGTTTVTAGTLVVNGSLGQGNLTVDAGATLKGSGVINGFTSIQGTHSPGNSPGLETFTNGLTYGSSSTLVWELSANSSLSADRGTLYDGINLTSGTLTIDPSAKIDLVFNAALAGGGPSTVDWDDPFWASSQTWKVIDVQSGLWTPGIFTLNSIGTDASGQSLSSSVRSSATFSLRQDNAGSVYVEYVIVPEPDTVIFAGIGIAMAGWSLWKRRRAS